MWHADRLLDPEGTPVHIAFPPLDRMRTQHIREISDPGLRDSHAVVIYENRRTDRQFGKAEA